MVAPVYTPPVVVDAEAATRDDLTASLALMCSVRDF
jgi:hypothetical protein